MSGRIFGTVDVARRASLTPARIRQLESEGKLRSERTPAGVRIFREDDVERFLEQRRKRAS